MEHSLEETDVLLMIQRRYIAQIITGDPSTVDDLEKTIMGATGSWPDRARLYRVSKNECNRIGRLLVEKKLTHLTGRNETPYLIRRELFCQTMEDNDRHSHEIMIMLDQVRNVAGYSGYCVYLIELLPYPSEPPTTAVLMDQLASLLGLPNEYEPHNYEQLITRYRDVN